MSTLEQIKKLREQTGAGIVDVKKALSEADGDENGAIEILRKKGGDKAVKKADRSASEGIIGTYIHSNQKIGAMVKVLCETDFVARNEDFQALVGDLAMHVTASNPVCVLPEEVSNDLVFKEREIWTAQLAEEGKPADMVEKILEGKEKKFREESALMTQVFVKDPDKTIQDLLNDAVIKIGEKIEVGDFVRYSL